MQDSIELCCTKLHEHWRYAQVGVGNIRAHMEKHAAEAEALARRRLELSRQACQAPWTVGWLDFVLETLYSDPNTSTLHGCTTGMGCVIARCQSPALCHAARLHQKGRSSPAFLSRCHARCLSISNNVILACSN